MASLISRASRAFDEGLQSVGRPFAQPGAPIPVAEPFSPGSTSVGALTAKLIRNIIAGSRMRGNEVRGNEIYDRQAQRQNLEMDVLRQGLEAGELVDFTDETGAVSQVPRRALATILAARERATKPEYNREDDPNAVGSRAWARVQQAKRRPAGSATGGPKASDVNAARTLLDAQVERDTNDAMARLWLPKSRTLLAQARDVNSPGHRRALQQLGVSPDLVAAAAGDGTDAPAARTVLEQALANGMENYIGRIKVMVKAAMQRRHAGKYGNLTSIAERAAGMEDEIAPEEAAADPNAEFEAQIQDALGGF